MEATHWWIYIKSKWPYLDTTIDFQPIAAIKSILFDFILIHMLPLSKIIQASVQSLHNKFNLKNNFTNDFFLN